MGVDGYAGVIYKTTIVPSNTFFLVWFISNTLRISVQYHMYLLFVHTQMFYSSQSESCKRMSKGGYLHLQL
jgi:hypothetical protein